MSEELKKKLNAYEADPPAPVWSRIAAALDEEFTGQFPQTLYNIEVSPPTGTWNKVVATLDAEVPVGYPTLLHDLEAIPPPGIWENISSALDQEESLPRIPSRKRVAPILKYAVAASVLGLVAFAAFRLLNRQAPSREVAVKTDIPQQKPAGTTQQTDQKNASAETTPALSNNLPKEGNLAIRANTGSRRRMQQAGYAAQPADVSFAARNSSAESFQQATLTGSIPGNNSFLSSDGYLMFMNPDGYLIRISKKLAEALGCYYTNGNSEEYQRCEDQMKKWRDKLGQSPSASSPDNFMDLLDIIKSDN